MNRLRMRRAAPATEMQQCRAFMVFALADCGFAQRGAGQAAALTARLIIVITVFDVVSVHLVVLAASAWAASRKAL
jgi:hypothetical protein